MRPLDTMDSRVNRFNCIVIVIMRRYAQSSVLRAAIGSDATRRGRQHHPRRHWRPTVPHQHAARHLEAVHCIL